VGMFDDIKYKTNCPVCSCVVTGFQSKDGDCFLNLLSPLEVLNFYSSCDNCGPRIVTGKQGN
jgi:DNA polymerase II large subunit